MGHTDPPTIGSLLCTPAIPEKVLSASSPPPQHGWEKGACTPLLSHLQPPNIWGREQQVRNRTQGLAGSDTLDPPPAKQSSCCCLLPSRDGRLISS